MNPTRRRRALAGALAGAALVLTGCAVPGQPAPAGAAAALDQTTITNAHVADLYDAWFVDVRHPANRRQVITLELMREPLLAVTDSIDFDYNRSLARQQAITLLQLQGSTEDPSEDLVDAVEGAYLIGAFALLPDALPVLREVADQVEADAVTSNRTGVFSADAFMASVEQVTPAAIEKANAGEPGWIADFNDVNGLVQAQAPWVVVE